MMADPDGSEDDSVMYGRMYSDCAFFSSMFFSHKKREISVGLFYRQDTKNPLIFEELICCGMRHKPKPFTAPSNPSFIFFTSAKAS